ncbi:MAG: hypothetical protein ACK4PI_02335 [Tepidisphaerales bacterium]
MTALAVVGVLLAAALGVWWTTSLRWQVYPRNFAAVDRNHLYRSGQISARLIEPTLSRYGIDTVVFMSTDNLQRADVRAEIDACNRLGIRRVNLPLGGDGTGNPDRYVQALLEIHRARLAGQQILVHCHTGSQRTGGVVALYRVLLEGWSATAARDELIDFGHDPSENPRLIPYLNEHLPYIASKLVEAGVLQRMPDPMPRFELPSGR